jgi:hypothetical protein
MQHVSSDDMQNAEASQDSDCPRLERWRWSPGVGAIGNRHIKIAFLDAFEGKLFVLIAPLPNSRSAAVQARPVAVKDIAGLIRERYGRCRISSLVRRLTSKGPARRSWRRGGRSAPRHYLNRGRMIANLGATAHPSSHHY